MPSLVNYFSEFGVNTYGTDDFLGYFIGTCSPKCSVKSLFYRSVGVIYIIKNNCYFGMVFGLLHVFPALIILKATF
jgi:hypothetical protein